MTKSQELTTTVSISVPFQDCDPAGVAWHGNYFRYFDTARCALLEQIDYSYRQMAESGFMWPIVDTRVKYIRAVSYDHIIHVTATLVEWEYRLKIEYEIHDDTGFLRYQRPYHSGCRRSGDRRTLHRLAARLYSTG